MAAAGRTAVTGGARRPGHDLYAQVLGTVYLGMMTNLLLAAACLPLLAVALAAGPAAGPVAGPVAGLLAPLVAPALCAAFGVFSAFSADPTVPVARTFGQGWVRCWRPALALGAAGTAVLGVLAVDVRAVWGAPVGALAIPVFVTLAVTALATTVVALVLVAERPRARLRDVVRVSVFLALRRWYLTVVSLLALAVLVTVVGVRPVLGLGLVAAPLLYVVWANAHHALQPALQPAPTA